MNSSVLMQPLILMPIIALVLGTLAVRAIRQAAPWVGFVDNPDRQRKLHETPIPLGGGVAVWAAAWSGWGLYRLGGMLGLLETDDKAWPCAILAVASFLTLVLGIVDDRFGMRGVHKLIGQAVVAMVLAGLGLRIDAIGGFGHTVELGALAYPATIFWIILVINAFNLIDGMDGFCGGVGFVVCLATAFLSYSSGRPGEAVVGLTLAGGLAAFLRDNLPPARIYLGDAGSMSLGMMIAALSIRACSNGPGTPVSIPPLLALLTLPLLDVVTALGRRWLTGHSLFMPDRGHIHHRLKNRLGDTRSALCVAAGLAALGACGAVLAQAWGYGDSVAVLTIVAPVALLVGTRTFGSSELRLLAYRLRATAARTLPGGGVHRGAIRHECRLLGVRNWAGVWNRLVESVESAGMRSVELTIEMPFVGETYYGLWTGPAAQARPAWSVVFALQVAGTQAGTIRVAGDIEPNRARSLDRVEDLVRGLESQVEAELARVLDDRYELDLATPRLGVVG